MLTINDTLARDDLPLETQRCTYRATIVGTQLSHYGCSVAQPARCQNATEGCKSSAGPFLRSDSHFERVVHSIGRSSIEGILTTNSPCAQPRFRDDSSQSRFALFKNVKSSLLNARFECPRVTSIMAKKSCGLRILKISSVEHHYTGIASGQLFHGSLLVLRKEHLETRRWLMFLKVSSNETHHPSESRNRAQGSRCLHPLAATPRRITQLCTCVAQ